MRELVEGGYTLSKAVGFTVKEMLEGGFTLPELLTLGYTIRDLKASISAKVGERAWRFQNININD